MSYAFFSPNPILWRPFWSCQVRFFASYFSTPALTYSCCGILVVVGQCNVVKWSAFPTDASLSRMFASSCHRSRACMGFSLGTHKSVDQDRHGKATRAMAVCFLGFSDLLVLIHGLVRAGLLKATCGRCHRPSSAFKSSTMDVMC